MQNECPQGKKNGFRGLSKCPVDLKRRPVSISSSALSPKAEQKLSTFPSYSSKHIGQVDNVIVADPAIRVASLMTVSIFQGIHESTAFPDGSSERKIGAPENEMSDGRKEMGEDFEGITSGRVMARLKHGFRIQSRKD
jgi:hypothetical protein